MARCLCCAPTSLSYVPQVEGMVARIHERPIIEDAGSAYVRLVLWICYGLATQDWIIVTANGTGAYLSRTVLLCKLRDIRSDP